MTHPKYYLLQDPVTWVGILAVAALAAVLLWIGWRCLNGSYRRWALAPPIPFQISNRNTWPFMLLCAGVAVALVVLTYPFEVMGWEDARQFMWTVPIMTPIVGTMMSFVYWPVALTPRWYKAWVRHPAYPHVSPWSPEEVSTVLSMPESRSRNRMLQDMEWSGIDVDKEWRQAGLAGSPPKSWVERKNDEATSEQAEAGITDDMDVLEKAAALRALRDKKKQDRKRHG